MSDPIRILGIDDSLTIRKLLELSFSRRDYLLDLASTGGEGIARARRAPPHLILLDYVLPDMKGIEVCAALAQDELTRSVPVIVMSAKSEGIRGLFKDFTGVAGFIAKPFTPPAISYLVSEILAKRAPARVAAPAGRPVAGGAAAAGEPARATVNGGAGGFTFAEKETAAKALFLHLRERFARIPEWIAELGGGAAAPFFARKILTPDCMEALLGALAPVFAATQPAAPPAASPAGDAQLRGSSAVIPLPRLLGELARQQRTGTLVLTQGDKLTTVYVGHGEPLLVTGGGGDDTALRSIAGVSGSSAQLLAAAAAEQERSGKPALVSLAEAGRIAAAELPGLLHETGKHALLEAIASGPCVFAWDELGELPGFVRAHGRALSLDQLQLERMRGVDDWSQVELAVGSHDLVFQRSPGFSQHIARFELNDAERRVLTLVNHRHTVKQIIERSRIATFEVFHVLFRLSQVGLIAKAEGGSRPGATARCAAAVMILEPDEGVLRPLDGLLAGRGIPLVALETLDGLAERLRRQRPQLLIINPAGGDGAEAALAAIRADVELSDLPVAAVLDSAALSAPSGCDAVLVKPLAFADLERLLDAPAVTALDHAGAGVEAGRA